MTLEGAVQALEQFQRGGLTRRLSTLERTFIGADRSASGRLCEQESVDAALVRSLTRVKSIAAQINVVIHAVGVLRALPFVLEPGELIEYLSLGAGNTGRAFDLATDRRVAEFKFIHWTGGSETIRQNQLFKDFFSLAEAHDERQRFLYVLGLTHPMKFFTGARNLRSVLSKNASVAEQFRAMYGTRFKVVGDYYKHRKRRVNLVDLLPVLPELATFDSSKAVGE